jgi:small subunit ribosomal protein S17e
MGRVKHIAVKTLGDDIIRSHRDKLSSDFGKNKQALGEIVEIRSKHIRNALAGYITQAMKRLREQNA